MINRINYIKNFGSFTNFIWKSINDFNDINLFFGWNGSGKTTLSRIFSSFEKCENHHKGSQFSIKLNDRNIDEKDIDSFRNIRVFNTDFIKHNIKWNNSEMDPFVIIGEESDELRTKLNLLTNQLDDKNNQLTVLVNETKTLSKNKDEFESRVAKYIKERLKIPGYDKRKLLEDLPEPTRLDELILSDEDIERNTNTLNNGNMKEKIPAVSIKILNLNDEQHIVNNLCKQVVSGERIQELIDDERYGKWIEEGLQLNMGHDHCRFCGSILDNRLMERYHKHFSDEYNKLLSKLKDKRADLYKIEFPTYIKDQFYPELEKDFIESDKELKRFITEYNKNVDGLVSLIDRKIENLFEIIQSEQFYFNQDTSALDHYNEVIVKNSTITDNFQKTKDDAFNRLKQHIIASEIKDSKYYDWIESIRLQDYNKNILLSELKTTEKSIQELKLKISNMDRATERVNTIIQTYFNKNDIVLKHEENNFYLYRQGIRAEDLSEGEQTAIAFSYFLARLEQSDLSDLIVFIDDPISSLDSNHLYITYSMICDTFYPYEKLLCRQLFISTHNYEFFTFFKEFFGNKKTSLYLLKRINNNDTTHSTIEKLPKILHDYNSEYVYLFRRMIDFNNNPREDFDQLYDLPNIVRKILDVYCQFKYQKKFYYSGKLLFENNLNDYFRVYKFTNHKSHLRIDGVLQLPELTDCEEIVSITLNAIKNNDETHYNCILNKNNDQ